ncbi:MAG TPA: carboxymuconolactone decarboxylase family protein [Pyrinomonadaceae bacterium]|nr:carboxymuconolactone decarboxylase family protein [Pyrinomonadaceae bacterium]
MKHTTILLMVTALVLSVAYAGRAQDAQAGTQSQTILRAGSQPSSKGPAENFTGNVTVAPLFSANASSPYSGAYVTFEAGARSAWHTHPAGQRLVVTSGVGRTAEWGGRVQEIKAGDVILCPPGVKHWHGASPTTAMTHLALTNTVNNRNVEWMEKVTDAQYNAGAQTMNTTHALSATQRSIIPIAAFTATGDQERLRTALTEGLEAGLTVNEIKEILIQMYAYAGFPRSLSGIQTFMVVMDERQAKGIKDQMGRDAASLPAGMNRDEYGARVRARLAGQKVIPPPGGYQLFTPVIDTFLKEHLFADIFARDILDHQSRELATIAALSSMTGTRSQLQFHLGAAMNVGLTEAQMRDFISVIAAKVGERESESAGEVLAAVLNSRK